MYPELSLMVTETLDRGGCTKAAFVTVPGNEIEMGWLLLNVPDNI
jgi:hypothetical protein